MAFANPLPPWALVLVVLAASLVAWLAYRRFPGARRRRAALTCLRCLTLLVLVACLMRPVARVEPGGRHGAVVPILVDTSRSMGIEDVGGRSRIEAARDLLASRILPALQPEFAVDVLAFGEDVRPAAVAELSASGRRSDLSRALAAVRERFDGAAVAGVVLVSDGGDTGGQAASMSEHGTQAPVYPIGLGAAVVGRDREVLGVTVAEVVLDDSRLELAASAIAHGQGTDPIELRLLENGRTVEVRRARPASDGAPVQEVFHIAPRPGAATIYTVEIPRASGELVPENNARSVLVQASGRPRRVLMVEGAPGFEHSFLKRALAADTGLLVDAVVRKGTTEDGGQTFYIQAGRQDGAQLASGFPPGAEALFGYDALVLANVERSDLSLAQLDMVHDFVATRGGGLLVLGARSFLKTGLRETAVEDVLPVPLDNRRDVALAAGPAGGVNRVTLSEDGRSHPIMQLGSPAETRDRWSRIPPLASSAPLGGPRPGATVLAFTGGAGGTARVLAAVQRFGEGRSMVFTGEASWRWRMMLPASDRSYETFWRQAVRWLSLPAAEAVTITAPADRAPGDTLPLRVVARNAAFEPQRDAIVDVTATAPDGGRQRLRATQGDEAGQFVAQVRVDQPGVYRVEAEVRIGTMLLGRPTASVLVGGADLEMTDPRLNVQLLQRVAGATGGQVARADAIETLVSGLRARVPAARAAAQRDLWHTGWSFAVVLALLLAEWILRRRWGLR